MSHNFDNYLFETVEKTAPFILSSSNKTHKKGRIAHKILQQTNLSHDFDLKIHRKLTSKFKSHKSDEFRMNRSMCVYSRSTVRSVSQIFQLGLIFFLCFSVSRSSPTAAPRRLIAFQ